MKRKLNEKGIMAISIVAFMLLIILITIVVYFCKLGSVKKESVIKNFEIEEGDTLISIANKLEQEKLIKSSLAYKIYIKTHKSSTIKMGIYELNQNMSVKEIVETLSGNNYKEDALNITFKEGININEIANIIDEKTNNTKEDVYNLLKDKEYINGLINKYWFLTEEITNENIYYPLEGYLFPNTYQFNKNVTVEEIFEVLLNQMDNELTKYKQEIENSNYTVHQLLTLASIVELEAGTSNDRESVARVFYNRLESGWTLGSDVTTYYAEQKTFKEDLLASELSACNSYNTRGTCFKGLPVGPISMPSEESIKGVMKPSQGDYYYFVADKNGNTYFNKTENEHQKTITKLKDDDLWYTYN